MPAGYVLFSAVAGGVAGAIVFLVASHWAGMVAGLLVFAASCGSYDREAEAEARREYEEQKRARQERKFTHDLWESVCCEGRQDN